MRHSYALGKTETRNVSGKFPDMGYKLLYRYAYCASRNERRSQLQTGCSRSYSIGYSEIHLKCVAAAGISARIQDLG